MQNYRNNTMTYNTSRQPHASCRLEHVRMDCHDDMFNHMSLAMAYVPWQTWRNIYDAEKGFHCGTIFQELNLPFLGKGGVKR